MTKLPIDVACLWAELSSETTPDLEKPSLLVALYQAMFDRTPDRHRPIEDVANEINLWIGLYDAPSPSPLGRALLAIDVLRVVLDDLGALEQFGGTLNPIDAYLRAVIEWQAENGC